MSLIAVMAWPVRKISGQFLHFASFNCVGESDFLPFHKQIWVSSITVVVAMETVNNPAAYTCAPTSVLASVKVF